MISDPVIYYENSSFLDNIYVYWRPIEEFRDKINNLK
jgi:hypothetical protein